MKSQYLLAGFVLFLLIQSSLALAISCDSVSESNYETCIDILNSGISENQKEILISNLEYDKKFFPDHNFIFDTNNKIDVKSSPEGVVERNKRFIKNVWVDIFSLMPSMIYNGSLYVPKKTSVFTGFNYEIEIPSNYYSGGYPETRKGDCKTKYYLREKNANNKVYVNDKYVGKGDFVDISIKDNSIIKSKLEISVRVKIKHYEWDRHCVSRSEDGSCRRYSYDCEYDYSETKEEKILLKDSINVKRYKNNPEGSVSPINYYSGTTILDINSNDSIEVSFEDSKYSFYKYLYSVQYSKPPYYIATLKAENYNREILSNLFKSGEDIAASNTKNCKIKAFDFFNVINKKCGESGQNPEFFIRTNKLKYDDGEEISIYIYPKNVSAKISYGGQTKVAKRNVIFTAKRNFNQIIVEKGDIKAEKIIYVSDKERLFLIWNLAIFAFLNYFLFVILRKYARKIK